MARMAREAFVAFVVEVLGVLVKVDGSFSFNYPSLIWVAGYLFWLFMSILYECIRFLLFFVV